MIPISPNKMEHGVEYYIATKYPMSSIGEVGNGKQIGVFDKVVFGNVASFSNISDINDIPSGLPDVGESGNRNPRQFVFYRRMTPEIMNVAEIRTRNRAVIETINNKTNTDIGRDVGTKWFAGKMKTSKRKKGRKSKTIKRRTAKQQRRKR